jgi:hypothetical protein
MEPTGALFIILMIVVVLFIVWRVEIAKCKIRKASTLAELSICHNSLSGFIKNLIQASYLTKRIRLVRSFIATTPSFLELIKKMRSCAHEARMLFEISENEILDSAYDALEHCFNYNEVEKLRTHLEHPHILHKIFHEEGSLCNDFYKSLIAKENYFSLKDAENAKYSIRELFTIYERAHLSEMVRRTLADHLSNLLEKVNRGIILNTFTEEEKERWKKVISYKHHYEQKVFAKYMHLFASAKKPPEQ